MAAGRSRGFHGSGKSGSRSCCKPGAWLCKNEPVLERMFLREGLRLVRVNVDVQKASLNIVSGETSCSTAGGTCKPRHTPARERTLRNIYLYSEPRPSLLPQTRGREMPAGSCSGSRGTKHSSHVFPLPVMVEKTLTTKDGVHFSPHFQRHCVIFAFHWQFPITQSSPLPAGRGSGRCSLLPIQTTALQNGSATDTAIPGFPNHKQIGY